VKIAFRPHLSPISALKVRPIWVFPFEILINEAIFVRNFYEELKIRCDPMHFGVNAMPKLCDFLNVDLDGDDLAAVTFDWSAFDKNIPDWLLNLGLDVIESCLDFSRMTNRGGMLPKFS